MAEPLVSAVVPVRDGERYLGEALESIASQTYERIETIVVDDGSRDGSAALARRFKGVRVIPQPAGGIAAARNRGVAASQGGLIAFLDADDIWLPVKTAVQLAAFAAEPAPDLVRSGVEHFLSPELDPATARVEVPHGPAAAMVVGAMLMTRALWERVGPFAQIRVGEVLDWMLRARRAGMSEHTTRDLVLRRRVHERNTSLARRAELGGYARVIKRELDARRAEAHREEELHLDD